MIRDLEIRLISRPRLDEAEIESFLTSEGTSWNRTQGATPPEELIEFCGRLCYLSFGSNQSERTNREYIRNLIESGHESVLEHVNWTFLLSGVSRAFTHQLVRHRVGFAFSQLSQQYHEENEPRFVMPVELRQSVVADVWRAQMIAASNAYRKIDVVLAEELGRSRGTIDKKERNRAVRSAARSVLPNATETKIAVTANARALRHLLNVRGSIVGDLEMRLVSVGLLSLLAKEAPSVFYDFRIADMDDGLPFVERL